MLANTSPPSREHPDACLWRPTFAPPLPYDGCLNSHGVTGLEQHSTRDLSRVREQTGDLEGT